MFLALVPAYNEEKTIGSVVSSLLPFVDAVVVIDDGSSDGTSDKAQNAGAVVIRHPLNRGQGAALETGHAYARYRDADEVVHFDGDGQLSAQEVAKAVKALRTSHADILLGSRFLTAPSSIPFSKRYVILPLARFFDRCVTGLSLTDAHNGFRVLNKKALNAIRITQDRMAHASEILVLIQKHGLKHIEFPVTVRYNEYGQGARASLIILKDMLMGIFVR